MSASKSKRINLSRSRMKLDVYDFALTLSHRTSSQQLETIISILHRNGFHHLLVNDPNLSSSYILLIRCNDLKAILKEAEKHNLLKPKHYEGSNSLDSNPKTPLIKKLLQESGSKNLDHRVKALENMGKFTYAKRRKFIKGISSPVNIFPK